MMQFFAELLNLIQKQSKNYEAEVLLKSKNLEFCWRAYWIRKFHVKYVEECWIQRETFNMIILFNTHKAGEQHIQIKE